MIIPIWCIPGDRGWVEGRLLSDLLFRIGVHPFHRRGRGPTRGLLPRPVLLGRWLLHHRFAPVESWEHHPQTIPLGLHVKRRSARRDLHGTDLVLLYFLASSPTGQDPDCLENNDAVSERWTDGHYWQSPAWAAALRTRRQNLGRLWL